MSASCRRGGKRIGPQVCIQLVRFQLDDQGAETKLIFDHTGFPQGAAAAPRAGMVVALLGAAPEVSGMRAALPMGDPRKDLENRFFTRSGKVSSASPIRVGLTLLYPTCYKRLFCAGRARTRVLLLLSAFSGRSRREIRRGQAQHSFRSCGGSVFGIPETIFEARLGSAYVAPRSRVSMLLPEGSA